MATQQQIATKLNRLFSFMPSGFKDKKNFSALMGAIAESDADLNNLFLEVRKQLFVNTAEDVYLDMLGANVGVSRPALVGMVDSDFREFIKLQTYHPKQVRSLLFKLMELFYGTDTIKANISSAAAGPYNILDGSTLNVMIDGITRKDITFLAASFNNSVAVTPQELTAQINTQVDGGMFASTYYNASDKLQYLQLFTDTFGPVGSIEIIGGTANRFLKFPDTMRLGSTITTKYRIVTSLTNTSLYWAGGDNPSFSQLTDGDSVILTGTPIYSDNVGSFLIDDIVDTSIPALILDATSATFMSANTVRYAMPATTSIVTGNQVIIDGFVNSSNNGTFVVLNVNASYIDLQTTRLDSADDEVAPATVDLLPSASRVLFSNPNGVNQAVFSVSTLDDVLFFRPVKRKLESVKRAATIWEINANEVIVTLPATPIIIRRSLAGSAHMQGADALIDKAFLSSIEMANTDYFPDLGGNFYLQKANGTVLRDIKYSYNLLNGNTLQGVNPTITPSGDKLSLGVGALSATSTSNIIQVTTISPHLLTSGELISVKNFNGFAGIPAQNLNGTRNIVTIIDDLNFTFTAGSAATSTTTNSPSYGKGEIFTARNSRVVITNVQQNTGYVGSYVYDPNNAQYTISGTQTTVTQDILLGQFGGSLSVFNSNVFPETSGQIVINYGKHDEEGPINYIAKPGVGSIFIDPAYRFKSSHSSGAAINLLSSRFATTPTVNGSNYPVYVVDTVTPRSTLENLLLDAKAAGISMKFVVILPENVYNLYQLY